MYSCSSHLRKFMADFSTEFHVADVVVAVSLPLSRCCCCRQARLASPKRGTCAHLRHRSHGLHRHRKSIITALSDHMGSTSHTVMYQLRPSSNDPRPNSYVIVPLCDTLARMPPL